MLRRCQVGRQSYRHFFVKWDSDVSARYVPLITLALGAGVASGVALIDRPARLGGARSFGCRFVTARGDLISASTAFGAGSGRTRALLKLLADSDA